MLFQKIKEKIKSHDKRELAQSMGYKSYGGFEKTANKFLQCSNLYAWLHKGHFDFTYTSEGFFIALCRVFQVAQTEIDDAFLEAKKLKNEIEKFKDAYIFVDTNFRRNNEPLFALAFCEKMRCIRLHEDKELLFKTNEEIVSIIGQRVKKHFQLHKNGLGVWGKIVAYNLHFMGDIYVFDTEGQISHDNPALESEAGLRLN